MPSKKKHNEFIIVLDFGAQYGQLIARRVRECRIYCEIMPYDTPVEELIARKPMGIIFSGGPASVYEPNAPVCDPAIFQSGIPILGICYGMQLMGKMLGGKVLPADKREFGKTELSVLSDADLFKSLNPQLICWMSHGDQVAEVPPGFVPLAQTRTAPIAAMGDRTRKLYGVQFHPEVVHTPWGIELFRNFLYQVCGCQGLWTMASVAEQATAQIRAEVGKKRVICGLSGGVDSSTVAAIVHRAIGDQLTCIFVDHGFLRKNEAAQVIAAFKDHLHANLVFKDASDRFLKMLEGVTDPEQKRILIGNEFVAVFEEEAKKIGRGVAYLAQGTLYPDVIESGTRTAAGIKSHHNVGGLPERMKLKLIEPLRNLFKDEVRRLAEEVGLPASLAWRQPFPGPGLAIRIMGEVDRDRLEILREADAVALDEIRKAGLYRHLFQSFAVLAPSLRSVGVMGDQRTYAYTCIIRAVTGDDAMTADWAKLPYEVLEHISNRIINEVRGINRVAYDISSKPPATIEWE